MKDNRSNGTYREIIEAGKGLCSGLGIKIAIGTYGAGSSAGVLVRGPTCLIKM